MKTKTPFAARVQGQRRQLGMSPEQLAEEMRRREFTDWTANSVVGVENDRRDVSFKEFYALADALRVSSDYLYDPQDVTLSEFPGYPSRFIVQAVGSGPKVLDSPPRLRPSRRAVMSPHVVSRHAALAGVCGHRKTPTRARDEQGAGLHRPPVRKRICGPHRLRVFEVAA
jgi:transcriptional regulator with XRE-family HTH domain